ncbi:5-methylcytosine-specific restriction enzyme B [Allopseudospirillum japonicum]|uniref:5-methylcytosine-specific restriction enzyme B n=1 Tax=Allopseudospirillum japonicum TaxID=64971 RepID=A0A1H6QHP7_9GAMM|nr:AAA family ATPase [Allopseudospirillum japonicum]SEI38522.1 5-methylcytosine-specific restriction enzyme B [Allopseudospirillum japonicum]
MIKPVNQIFYGPPGTGKTYYWCTELQPKYESQVSSVFLGEWFEDQLADTTWWEVIALVLADLLARGQGTRVQDVLIHPYFKAKARVQGRAESQTLQNTCWASLQTHTVLTSRTVNYARNKRQPPLIFDKQQGGHWILTGDWEEAGEALREQLQRLQQGPQHETARIKRHLMVTFHQAFSYEDFVEGIRPQTAEGDISYEVRDGVFKAFCQRARQDPQQRYAVFIDEINRGNIAGIFGDLMTLIEVDKRAVWNQDGQLIQGLEMTLPYSAERFGVPHNVDIYAAMNTADRSIQLMDAALRRRFHFIEFMPAPEKIPGTQGDGYIPDGEGGKLNLRALLAVINLRVRYLLHRDQTFGHAFLMDAQSIEDVRTVLVQDILPMLAEYFYEDWQQIRQILADTQAPLQHQIITQSPLDHKTLFAEASDHSPQGFDYQVRAPQDITAEAIRKIYHRLEDNI